MRHTETSHNIEIRPFSGGDPSVYFNPTCYAFATTASQEDADFWRETVGEDRALGAWHEGELVGTADSPPFQLTVPGNRLTMAGVGYVAVSPNHRRRGILTALLHILLDDARERGDVFAGLWASEATIYGRFGFGAATSSARLELPLDAPLSLTTRGRTHDQDIKILDDLAAISHLPPIYEKVQAKVPGMLDRSTARWRRWVHKDPGDWRDLSSDVHLGPRVHARVGDDGYVSYRLQRRWDFDVPTYRVLVVELMAANSATYHYIWDWLFSMDLASSLMASRRPPDDPLLLALPDRRRVRVRITDGLWLRILDTATALSARSYAGTGSLVVRVVDAFGAWASGTYALTSEGETATCIPTNQTPDIVLPVSALSAGYLGNTRFQLLERAGVVEEHTPGTLALMDRLFSTDPLPWCCVGF